MVFNSRTLTAVHDAILDDLVFPAEIVGKRTRVKLDGTKLLKVHLDRSQQTNIEHKVSIMVEFIAACLSINLYRLMFLLVCINI